MIVPDPVGARSPTPNPGDFGAEGSGTRLLAGVRVPETPPISQAIEYARLHSEPYLFNHVMRSWLFAVSLAQLNDVEHDGEVLAVATLLHDLGLGKAFAGPLRFEVESANVARQFARELGVDEHRAQLIWDGVALNSTPSIGLYKEKEVALCTSGVGLDWGGWGYESLPQSGSRMPCAGSWRRGRRPRTTTSPGISASGTFRGTSGSRRWTCS
jgi:hypothetical protein